MSKSTGKPGVGEDKRSSIITLHNMGLYCSRTGIFEDQSPDLNSRPMVVFTVSQKGSHQVNLYIPKNRCYGEAVFMYFAHLCFNHSGFKPSTKHTCFSHFYGKVATSDDIGYVSACSESICRTSMTNNLLMAIYHDRV